jgi:D-sedoheptulose 7-phosphate isomerase
LETFAKTLRRLPTDKIAELADVLLDAYERNARLFIAGNGGSAALASHFACDLQKSVCGVNPRQKQKRFRVIALTDNVATLTAWANDEGYPHIFSEPLKNLAEPGDLFIAISASGNSPNVVEALRTAREMGLHTIGWLGFSGGAALELCDTALHVPVDDYGLVEGAHDVLAHLLTAWLTEAVVDREQQHTGNHRG